ncbi:hypothetical protein JCM11251_003479 [Rhodosporidiobolus azoricus]
MTHPQTLEAYLGLPSTGVFYRTLFSTLRRLCQLVRVHHIGFTPEQQAEYVRAEQYLGFGEQDWEAQSMHLRSMILKEAAVLTSQNAFAIVHFRHVDAGQRTELALSNMLEMYPVAERRILQDEIASWNHDGFKSFIAARSMWALVRAIHQQQPTKLPKLADLNYLARLYQGLLEPFAHQEQIHSVRSLSHMSPRQEEHYFGHGRTVGGRW